MAGSPPVLLDGAHNPDGFEVLGNALSEEFGNRRWVLVLAVMEDKDLAAMLPHLRGRIQEVVATRADSPRALHPDKLAEVASELLSVPAQSFPEQAEALSAAKSLATEDGAILVTGSLYLVGAFRSLLTGGGEVQRNER